MSTSHEEIENAIKEITIVVECPVNGYTRWLTGSQFLKVIDKEIWVTWVCHCDLHAGQTTFTEKLNQ